MNWNLFWLLWLQVPIAGVSIAIAIFFIGSAVRHATRPWDN